MFSPMIWSRILLRANPYILAFKKSGFYFLELSFEYSSLFEKVVSYDNASVWFITVNSFFVLSHFAQPW